MSDFVGQREPESPEHLRRRVRVQACINLDQAALEPDRAEHVRTPKRRPQIIHLEGQLELHLEHFLDGDRERHRNASIARVLRQKKFRILLDAFLGNEWNFADRGSPVHWVPSFAPISLA